jgi:hypothetical protein
LCIISNTQNKKEEQNMKTNLLKNTELIALSFLILAFVFASCTKEQQLPKSSRSNSNSSLSNSSATVSVTGGGQGTFYADIDGDGKIDGSHLVLVFPFREMVLQRDTLIVLWLVMQKYWG